jgi:hypothetical protein
MDVVSVSKLDLPGAKTDSALRLGMKYAIVCVDDYSRLKKVYFSKYLASVPRLIRMFLLEMGSHVFA